MKFNEEICKTFSKLLGTKLYDIRLNWLFTTIYCMHLNESGAALPGVIGRLIIPVVECLWLVPPSSQRLADYLGKPSSVAQSDGRALVCKTRGLGIQSWSSLVRVTWPLQVTLFKNLDGQETEGCMDFSWEESVEWFYNKLLPNTQILTPKQPLMFCHKFQYWSFG